MNLENLLTKKIFFDHKFTLSKFKKAANRFFIKCYSQIYCRGRLFSSEASSVEEAPSGGDARHFFYFLPSAETVAAAAEDAEAEAEAAEEELLEEELERGQVSASGMQGGRESHIRNCCRPNKTELGSTTRNVDDRGGWVFFSRAAFLGNFKLSRLQLRVAV